MDSNDTLTALTAGPRIPGVRLGWVVDLHRDGRPIVDYPGNPFGPLSARSTESIAPAALQAAWQSQRGVVLVFDQQDPGLPVILAVLAEDSDASTPAELATAPAPISSPSTRTDTSPLAAAQLARIVSAEKGLVWVAIEEQPDRPLQARTTVPLRNLKDPVLVLPTSGGPVIVGQIYPDVPVAADSAESCEIVLRARAIRIQADEQIVIQAGNSQLQLDARGTALTTADHVTSRARSVNKVQGGCIKLN